MAGGYAAGSAAQNGQWLIDTVYAPTTVTTDETFLWYSVSPRLSLGVAHLWKQSAFRALASFELSPESDSMPSLHVSAGVQGIGTGNPGLSATAEKNFPFGHGTLNVFAGLGYRTNVRVMSGVGGIKWAPGDGWAFGYQNDGVAQYPFASYSFSNVTLGIYLINFKAPAVLVGTSF